MNERAVEAAQVYLKAGEIVMSDQPHVVLTVLGSCLSVTMHHRRSRLSAICHGLLPHCRERATCTADCHEMAKYVECAMLWMLKRFRESGIPPRELEIKLFGGADMFGFRADRENGPISVGRQNIAVAQRILAQEGLTASAQDIGGNQGRKLFFTMHAGEVMLKRLPANVILADPGARKK